MISIEARDVSVDLGKAQVVQGLSLKVSAGQLTGLIGPNGAGKSTFIKALGGFLTPRIGQVLLHGKPMNEWRRQERAQQVGYLPQGGYIHWPLEVSRTVELGRIPHQAPWQPLSQKDHEAVQQAMSVTDIESLSHRCVDTLAGGEKTLVMLARVLAGTPSVILADEPVAGLDPHHQLQVMELLASRAQQGCAVLVVLHDLSLAARFCHNLVFLKSGKVIASGSPREVLTAENLRTGYAISARFGTESDILSVVPWMRL